jgi:hypothetical protein
MLPLFFTQSKKFSELIYGGEKCEFLGSTPSLGKRINLFFLKIDIYICETEPKLEPCKGLRIVSWHVPKNKDLFEKIKKSEWFGPFGKRSPIANPVPFIDAQDPEYSKQWSKNKRDHRKAWLRQLDNKELVVSECDLDVFLQNFLNSNLSKKVKSFNQEQIGKLKDIYNEKMIFKTVSDPSTGEIVAGVSILHDDDLNQVIYQFCFSEKKYHHVGVGLVDLCVQYAKDNNLMYVNLTPVKPTGYGDKKWSGFTKFKLEFNPIIIYFRQSYFKITFNW